MISIGNMDIGKAVVQLEFQTRLNTLILEWLLNNRGGVLTQKEIEDFKEKATNLVNSKFGDNVMSYHRQMVAAQ